MAATSERKAGLDLGHPGGREYLIVSGVAFGAGLLYFWLRGRNKAPAAAADPGSSAPSTPTGLRTADFSSWVHDHQRTTTTRDDDDDDDRKHAKKVTVPDVVGDRYRAAAEALSDEGLVAQRGSPFVGKVARESPRAGSKVRRGSVVVLSGEPRGRAGGHDCPAGSRWDAGKKRCVPEPGGH